MKDFSSRKARLKYASVGAPEAPEHFVHDSLLDDAQRIRLLRLDPDREAGVLAFSISTVNVRTSWLAFNAISYVWGNDKADQNILVNGKPFKVRPNCRYALWQCSLHYPTDFLWIDSVSINQEDLVEKSEQIRIMGDIFASARRILGCIGPHDMSSRSFFEWVGKAEADGCVARENTEAESEHLKSWLGGLPERSTRSVILSFLDLANREYWKRVWVVPEIGVPGGTKCRLLCGEDEVHWVPVSILADHASFYHMRMKTPALHLTKLIGDFPVIGLEDVVRLYGDYKCSDSRDRVFAFLHRIDWPKDVAQTRPDYEQSPYDLALSLVPLLAQGELLHLFEALEVFYHNEKVKNALALRRKRGRRSCELATMKEHTNIWFTIEQSAILTATTEGRLMANLVRPESSKPIERDLFTAATETMLRRRYPFQDHQPRKVYNGSDAVVLACPHATAGDLLLPWTKTRVNADYFEELYLVARPDGNDCYTIIGQALSLRECYIADRKIPGQTSFKFEVALSLEDVAILYVQDLAGYHAYSRVARIERLTTAVSTSPRRAVRRVAVLEDEKTVSVSSQWSDEVRSRKKRLESAAMEKYGDWMWLRPKHHWADPDLENVNRFYTLDGVENGTLSVTEVGVDDGIERI